MDRTSSDDDFIFVYNQNGEDVRHVDISELPWRFNSYHVLDQNGRRRLELCQVSGFSLVNGRLHAEEGNGKFTFCSHGV